MLFQVNHLDFKLYGRYPEAAKSINSYWENVYDHEDSAHRDDIHTTHFHAFARIGLSKVNPSSENNEDCIITMTKLKLVRLEICRKRLPFMSTTYLDALFVECRILGSLECTLIICCLRFKIQ